MSEASKVRRFVIRLFQAVAAMFFVSVWIIVASTLNSPVQEKYDHCPINPDYKVHFWFLHIPFDNGEPSHICHVREPSSVVF